MHDAYLSCGAQGRRQKNFQGRGATEKRPKNSSIERLCGGGATKKDQKRLKNSTFKYYICAMYEKPGGATVPLCRRPW